MCSRDPTLNLNAGSYGLVGLVSEIVISKQKDQSDPNMCGKCVRGSACRVAGIKCSKHCNCKEDERCKSHIIE